MPGMLKILHVEVPDAITEDRVILERMGQVFSAVDTSSASNLIATTPTFDVVVISHDEGVSDAVDLLAALHDWDLPVVVIEDYDTLAPTVLSLTLGEHIVRTLSLPMTLPARIHRLIRLRALRQEADRYILGYSGPSPISIGLSARDRFLAHVVHEMRNPLHGMLGLVDILKTTDLDEEQSAYCVLLQNAGEGINGMIEDLIEFSRTEIQEKTGCETAEVAAILRSSVERHQHTADFTGLDLSLEIDTSIGSSAVCPLLVGRILDKLIMNALLYTNQGSVRVHGGIQGKLYQFDIQDTGRGIPSGLKDSLFEPFRRYQSVTEKALPGLGLGLTLARMWARRLNGDVQLNDAPHGGTLATVTIPMSSPPMQL